MAWIDDKKAYDMVPQNVHDIRRCHKVYGENHGKLESRIDNKRKITFAEVKIYGGIFQRDALTPLLLVTAMMPASNIFWK